MMIRRLNAFPPIVVSAVEVSAIVTFVFVAMDHALQIKESSTDSSMMQPCPAATACPLASAIT